MKATDRSILVVLGALVAIAAIWFLLITPKRDQASQLSAEVDDLRASVEQAELSATAAEAAKADYQRNYHQLVVLGKAAPASDDTASLFVQFDEVAGSSGVDLRGITLAGGGGGAQTAAAQTTTDQSLEQAESGAEATPAATPATEATAALLPIGAAIGPAGLPVMPYELTLKADYFQLSTFIDGLQELVGYRHGRPTVDGRLVTIDGFTFEGDTEVGFPALDATLNVTTFLSPTDQGVTAGATPAAPTPAGAAPPETAAVPASETSTTPTP
jgi:hypothetical protein